MTAAAPLAFNISTSSHAGYDAACCWRQFRRKINTSTSPHAGYDGGLLRAAVDLADRLMPAFDTPTRIPLSWVNLRRVTSAV